MIMVRKKEKKDNKEFDVYQEVVFEKIVAIEILKE